MHKVRKLGGATLELLAPLEAQVAFSDFCIPAGTISFLAREGFLRNSLQLFSLKFPGYVLEAKVRDGMIFIWRNGLYQHSEQYSGDGACQVALQWDVDSIGCGIIAPGEAGDMNHHMRAVRTPITVPPAELVRMLRTENLLCNEAYLSAEDFFTTVLDCFHLCELDIRRHGAERFAWKEKGKSLGEPQITTLVASFLSSHGAARNFDTLCEPHIGSGKLDLYAVAPVLGTGLAKIAIEAKKADSDSIVHGLSNQLPEYMTRLGTSFGIYVVYWLKSSDYPHPSQASYAELEIEKLHPVRRPTTARTVGLNLSLAPPPSSRR